MLLSLSGKVKKTWERFAMDGSKYSNDDDITLIDTIQKVISVIR